MDNDDALTDDETMKTLVRRDLVMNVFKHGQWGTYRHVPLKPGNRIYCETRMSYGVVYVFRFCVIIELIPGIFNIYMRVTDEALLATTN